MWLVTPVLDKADVGHFYLADVLLESSAADIYYS